MSEPRRSDPHRLVQLVAELADDTALHSQLADATAGLATWTEESDAVLERLVRAFGLSPFERDLLLLAGLPEEHEALTQVFRLLHPRGEPALCAASAGRVLRLDAAGRDHLRTALDSGPLRQHHLLTGSPSVPLPERSLRLTPGLWAVLRGVDHWPAEVVPHRVVPMDGAPLPSARVRRAVAGESRLIVVSGGPSAPLPEVASLIAGALDDEGLRWVALDPAATTGDQSRIASAHAIARDAVPVVVGAPEAPPLPQHPGPVVACVASVAGMPMDDRPVVMLEWSERNLGESATMWNGLLPELNGEAAALAGLLRIDRHGASRAVADARLSATVESAPVSAASVVRQVRRRTDVTLPASVRMIRPTAGWDGIVLSPEQETLLRSVVGRVRGQVRVLHEWGFESARGTRGVRLLLSGPPGTGKTLAAEVLAAELGLDLLVVDLASLVSKWLGETEKNIGEVFDAAERCQAVLLFDEADAIFGRRTDSGDAQGRWANLETAYLLSRIDRFDGLVALATNLRGHIDDAFVRRLDVVVELEEPEADERDRLWRAHLPDTAPYAQDVDIPQLATLYPISGGLIRNAALAAAFDAAEADSAIDQQALVVAIRTEYVKAGRSFPGVPRALQTPTRKAP